MSSLSFWRDYRGLLSPFTSPMFNGYRWVNYNYHQLFCWSCVTKYALFWYYTWFAACWPIIEAICSDVPISRSRSEPRQSLQLVELEGQKRKLALLIRGRDQRHDSRPIERSTCQLGYVRSSDLGMLFNCRSKLHRFGTGTRCSDAQDCLVLHWPLSPYWILQTLPTPSLDWRPSARCGIALVIW